MTAAPRVALASRGDALTPYLYAALERAFPAVDSIDAELTAAQRYAIAAVTARPTRSAWAERFYKSGVAGRMRSANAARALDALPARPDVLLQVHALFALAGPPAALYVDITHRQSADQWPAWNPLHGRALDAWYRREQRAYDAAAHVFAFCEPTADSLVRDYGLAPAKVTVVGAGVNLPALPTLAPTRTTEPPTILFVGNDWRRKGGDVLLRAFRRVRAVLPEVRLQLVGTRPPITPEPGVEILGRIRDRDRIADLYAHATVFTVPSLFDPFPLALLEAMAFGLPVVATTQTGVPEMVTDGRTGRLVPPNDADALAEALLSLLRDPDAADRLGAAARASVEEKFTWDSVVDRMTPALSALAAEPEPFDARRWPSPSSVRAS